MPQFRNSQRCQGFVNPAELYSTFPIVYDQDMTAHYQYDAYSDVDSRMSVDSFYQDSLLNTKVETQGWKCDSTDYSMSPTWPTETGAGTPGMRDDCSGSSASNSPSPGNTTTQQGQSHKRRAQNRAAQRAYRDRKMRYLLDLQSGIGEIEQKIRRLQTENTELIRQLCEMRAANNDLRDSTRSKDANSSTQIDDAGSDLSSQDGPAEVWSKANFASPATGELDALYEPFAAMWNLIHLDPSVVRGTVSAETVLERLRAMVEFTASKPDLKAPRSYSTSAIPDWPSRTSAPT